MNQADVVELILGVAALVLLMVGLWELWMDRKEARRRPFDWAIAQPEWRQSSHVKINEHLSKKGTCQDDDYGGTQRDQEDGPWELFAWGGFIG